MHEPVNRDVRRCLRIACASLLVLLVPACGKQGVDDSSVAYRAACEGPPLGTTEKRNQAMEDGYGYNRRYDCIDKASYAEVQAQKAQWQADHTPEAIAAREREYAEQRRLGERQRAEARAAEARLAAEPLPPVEIHLRDANTATQAELAQMVSLGADVAAQIVTARSERPFKDWADLVNRVIGLHAAQPAVFASVNGLTVNGQSLEGMPPDAAAAAQLYQIYHPRRTP